MESHISTHDPIFLVQFTSWRFDSARSHQGAQSNRRLFRNSLQVLSERVDALFSASRTSRAKQIKPGRGGLARDERSRVAGAWGRTVSTMERQTQPAIGADHCRRQPERRPKLTAFNTFLNASLLLLPNLMSEYDGRLTTSRHLDRRTRRQENTRILKVEPVVSPSFGRRNKLGPNFVAASFFEKPSHLNHNPHD